MPTYHNANTEDVRITPMSYKFDRYIDGRLMAEGVCIYHASTEAEALEKARKMYAGAAAPGEMKRTTFVRVEPEAPALTKDK